MRRRTMMAKGTKRRSSGGGGSGGSTSGRSRSAAVSAASTSTAHIPKYFLINLSLLSFQLPLLLTSSLQPFVSELAIYYGLLYIYAKLPSKPFGFVSLFLYSRIDLGI